MSFENKSNIDMVYAVVCINGCDFNIQRIYINDQDAFDYCASLIAQNDQDERIYYVEECDFHDDIREIVGKEKINKEWFDFVKKEFTRRMYGTKK